MRVEKLMARLNPKNVRFDVGLGGLPEFTPQDIAAALGFVPAGLGRELFCRLWWPDGARLMRDELERQLTAAQFGEYRERMDALVTAQLRERMATCDRDRHRAAQAIEEARQRHWPLMNGTFDKIRVAVVREFCEPRYCSACEGRGHICREGDDNHCERCGGLGKVQCSDRWRARQLGIVPSAYLKNWKEPYEWLFAYCTDVVAATTRSMTRALV